MGNATRWFKSLLGMKKEKSRDMESATPASGDKRERKRWSFSKSWKDSAGAAAGNFQRRGPMPQPPSDSIISDNACWHEPYVGEKVRKERNKQAIAVAAATAAAADAAVAAAEAALAAAVKLSSHRRGTMARGGRERWAAVKIQTAFRGFLARKALRALKGLVKLQALVRGYLTRKRATATLNCMQAMARAQAKVRSHLAHRLVDKENRICPENRSRKLIEKYDDTGSAFPSKRFSGSYEIPSGSEDGVKIVEVDTVKLPRQPKSRQIHSPLIEHIKDSPSYTNLKLRHQNVRDLEWNNSPGDVYLSSRPPASSLLGNDSCRDSFYQACSELPNYMAKTQSFRAKLRSQSTPRQGPSDRLAKRLTLSEIMAARHSVSAVWMQ